MCVIFSEVFSFCVSVCVHSCVVVPATGGGEGRARAYWITGKRLLLRSEARGRGRWRGEKEERKREETVM